LLGAIPLILRGLFCARRLFLFARWSAAPATNRPSAPGGWDMSRFLTPAELARKLDEVAAQWPAEPADESAALDRQ